jgi:hypothetical protein
MLKIPYLLTLSFLVGLGAAWGAVTDVQREAVARVWVAQHNDKLDSDTQEYAKKINPNKPYFALASIHRKVVKMKALALTRAEALGVPTEVKHDNGDPTPLSALYEVKSSGQTLLIADYTDEYDALLSTTDIFIKIGLEFKPLFHGEGFPKSARLISIGKDAPRFFEVGTYDGGSQVVKTLYTFDEDALQKLPQDVYDDIRAVKTANYIKQQLQVTSTLEGYLLYKDVDKSGLLSVVNVTRVDLPDDLKAKLKSTYGQDENGQAGFTRKTLTVYKWDGDKFTSLGDYFY